MNKCKFRRVNVLRAEYAWLPLALRMAKLITRREYSLQAMSLVINTFLFTINHDCIRITDDPAVDASANAREKLLS